MGRFINKDPIEEQGGLNLYGFCANNGVNYYDYLGMNLEDQFGRGIYEADGGGGVAGGSLIGAWWDTASREGKIIVNPSSGERILMDAGAGPAEARMLAAAIAQNGFAATVTTLGGSLETFGLLGTVYGESVNGEGVSIEMPVFKVTPETAPNNPAQPGAIYSLGRDIDLPGGRAGTHQFTAVVPIDPSKLPSAHLVDVGDGRRGFTVGAHNVNGNLQVVINQTGDLAATRENFSGKVVGTSRHPESYVVKLPAGVTSTAYGQQLLDAARNFARNTRSNPIDYPTGGLGRNSNTWNISIHIFLGGSTVTDFKGLEPGNDSRFPNNLFLPPPPPPTPPRG